MSKKTPPKAIDETIIPAAELPPKTQEQIDKNIVSQSDAAAFEFRTGFEFLEKYPHRVTIFGSARALPESLHYKAAEELAGRIALELNLVVVTGGGPGIMEAANKGARLVRNLVTDPAQQAAMPKTIGLSIGLPREQKLNDYVDNALCFNHFFARKAMLAFADKAYVFFPGGFGTFDELFGILTLIQTHKIPRVPVVLVGSDFWKPLTSFIKTNLFENHAAVSKGDMRIYTISDDTKQILDIIKNGPTSEWWRDAD